MTSIRIGLVTLGWPGINTSNGIATSVFHLANGLYEIGHQPIIIAENIDATPPSHIPFVTFGGGEWSFIDKLRSKLGNPFVAFDLRARAVADAAQKAAEIHGLDILLVEETRGWVGSLVDLLPVPVVAVLHGPWVMLAPHVVGQETSDDKKRQAREAKALQKVSGILAPSQASMAVTKELPGCRYIPKSIVPNAIDPGSETTRTFSDEDPHILFVGRFDRLKGADTVLKAFELLGEKHPKAQLTFVGPDSGLPQAGGTEIKINDALAQIPEAIGSRIHYTGKLNREEIADIRATHDIVVIASRFENLNYTLLEAMVAGQAIVCTDVGGPAEVLENGKTALVVPPGDPVAMAEALGHLYVDQKMRRSLGNNARTEVVESYSPTVIATKTIDLVRTILDQERS